MKKYNKILLYVILLVFIMSIPLEAKDNSKTIMIILDDLDFTRIENIVENYYGIGLMNIKGRSPSSDEGLYMSISSGRKLRIDKDKYKGLDTKGTGLEIREYEELYKNVLKKNDNIKLNLLGDTISTSFIGDDSSSLIASDSKGNIDFGLNYIEYDRDWLFEQTEIALDETDLLVLSYKIEEQNDRTEILKQYINEFRSNNIMIIPRTTSKNIRFVFNRNLTPVLYLKNGDVGILESKSTKREGFITIEDISHEILANNDIDLKNIGNDINIIKNNRPLESGLSLFKWTFNLFLIAIIFQSLTYINQAITAYSILSESNPIDFKFLNRFMFINMLISLIMGVFNIHRYILLYLLINIGISYYLAKRLENEKDLLGKISTVIYIVMTVGILLKPEIIYNSYYGFNNLFYGARYYGFNNGAMGIYIASSILSYFYMRNKIDKKIIKHIMAFMYFGLNMLILSAANAANTGGFITAVVLFLAMVYICMLEDKSNFKRVAVLLVFGLLIFGVNMYFDSKSLDQSHAIGFLMRIKEFGMPELVNMVKIKLIELIKYTILPPFSIVMVLQVLSLRKLDKIIDGELKKVSRLLFFISIVAFLINDTGMIAFIFINQFTIGNIISKLEVIEV